MYEIVSGCTNPHVPYISYNGNAISYMDARKS